MPRFLCSLLLLALAANLRPAHALPIALTSPVATFDQGGAFTVASSLDGSPFDGGSGWGVFGGQYVAQAAAWTTSAPVSTAEGLVFTLYCSLDAVHFPQLFRLSATTDATPSLAGNWTPLTVTALLGSGSASLALQTPTDVLATGPGTTVNTFQLVVAGAFAGVTGFRMDVLPYDYAPGGIAASLGRAGNGNFVVSQFQADTLDSQNWARGKLVSSSGAVFSTGLAARFIADGSTTTLSHSAAGLNPGFAYTLDLGAPVTLSSLELVNRADGCCTDRLSNYRVQLLDIAQAPVWSGDLRTDGSNSGVAGVDVITPASGNGTFRGRYVRVTSLGAQDYRPQISELRAFGQPALIATTGNLALGRPITASGPLWPGFPVTNLVDGNPSTFTHPLAAADTLGFFYEIDLGRAHVLDHLLLRNRNDGSNPERLTRCQLQLYDAGEGEGPGTLTWYADLRPDGSNSGVGGTDLLTAGSGTGEFRGRYLRLVNLGNLAYNPQAAEIEVYGALVPVIESFALTGPELLTSGESTTLAWSVRDATGVALLPAPGTVSTNGTLVVSPSLSTLYTLVASNLFGAVSNSLWVGVDETLLPPVISEFAADNVSLEDEDGDAPDWIEIRNPNRFHLPMAGYALTDDPALVNIWTFPAFSLRPFEHRVVFASGKNRTNDTQRLHTDFSLARGGEYLALLAPATSAVLQEFAPAFPPQSKVLSYGIPSDGGAPGYFSPATPGQPNAAATYAGLVGDTHFSVSGGFFTNGFSVALACDTPDAEIRYTVNGDPPTATTGTVYAGPFAIPSTTILRVAAFKPGWAPSNLDTASYIFPAAVLNQPSNPAGFPATWSDLGATVTADYAMDPDVVNAPATAAEMQSSALTGIRTLSIVANPADLFGANGLYNNPQQRGAAWERNIQAELLLPPDPDHPNGRSAFKERCGLRIFGYGWRAHSASLKHSFRLRFDSAIGESKLAYPLFPGWPVTRHDNLVLRSQGSRGWNDFRTSIAQTQYIHDAFARESAAAMGKADGPSTHVHLYLNGLYWGLYEVVLRPDAGFGEEHYGGADEEYDAINARVGALEAVDGDLFAWNQVLALMAGGFASEPNYQALLGLVDIDNLCDYLLFQLYAGNQDGPNNQNNFRALRKRAPDGRWRFFFWDMEYTLWGPADDTLATVVSSGSTVYPLFQALRQNAGFRLRFADRVQRHCFAGGALTPAASIARWNARADTLFSAILAESARWGDARREPPYTRDVEWAAERARLTTVYFPQRTTNLVAQLTAANLFPTTAAPLLAPQGGPVPPGTTVTLTAAAGTIHYTLDGSDPRDASGAAVGTLYSSPVVLATTGAVVLNARTLDAGVWSALASATFLVGTVPAAAGNLAVGELHYHPATGDEFIEVVNFSTNSVDLGGCQFTEGIRYTFPVGTALAPGQRLVIREPDWFGNLNNGGERLTLAQPDGLSAIRSFVYNNAAPWPTTPDGLGPSLVLIAPAPDRDHSDPLNWRASLLAGGNAGGADAVPFTGDPLADADGDGVRALAEYAFGTSDLDNAAGPLALTAAYEAPGFLLATLRRAPAADDARVTLETATDLPLFTPATGALRLSSIPNGDHLLETWRVPAAPDAPRLYLRVRVE